MAKTPQRKPSKLCYGCIYVDSNHECTCDQLKPTLPRTKAYSDLDQSSLEDTQEYSPQFSSVPDDWPHSFVGHEKLKKESDSEDDVSDDNCQQCFYLADILSDIKAVLKSKLSVSRKIERINALL